MSEAIKLFNIGKVRESIDLLKTLERQSPKEINIKYNLALILGMCGNFNEEQEKYEDILKINKNDLETLINYSVSLNETKNFKQSIEISNRAITLNPIIPEAYEARGVAKQQIDNIDEANEDFKKWIELLSRNENDKNISLIKECLDLIKLPAIYMSKEEIQKKRNQIENQIEKILFMIDVQQKKNSATKLNKSLAFKLNRFYLAYQQKNDKELNEAYFKITKLLLESFENDNHKKIIKTNTDSKTCAVISTFKYHPKLFIKEQLEGIDEKIKKILIIINNPGFDKTLFSDEYSIEFINMSPSNIDNIVNAIRKKNIDILFMPDIGMSIESQILATYKLANITFTTWLHPVTSGSEYVDYFLSGKSMEPKGSINHYSESLIKLPGIGLYINAMNYISTTHEEINLKRNNEIFRVGCLHTPFKYHPEFDNILIQIANKIKKINFIFIEYQEDLDKKLIERIKNKFIKENLDPNMIHVERRRNGIEYRKFLTTLDVALDTIGWSGGNTTLDCLGAALPVLTVRGELMRSNHTAGIYEIINLDFFVNKNLNELINSTYELSKNKKKLIDIKHQILDKFTNLKTDSYISNFINNTLHAGY